MILKIIGWVLGVFSIAMVAQFFERGEILAGFICVFAIGFLIPPLREKLNENMNKKGNNAAEISLKQGVIGGVVLILIAAIISTPETSKEENAEVKKEIVTQKNNENNFLEMAPIDLMYNLLTIVDQLNGFWFGGVYTENDTKRFYHIKTDFIKSVDDICYAFDQLVKRTGNFNSEYHEELTACNQYSFNLVQLQLKLNRGKFEEIVKMKQDFQPHRENLKRQVDEYIKTLN